MNRSQLIEAISEETTFAKKDVVKVLASLTRVIERTLKKGEKVSVTGWGTFSLSSRPARMGINPMNKEKIKLPAISLPRFKAGKNLREQVKCIRIAR